MSESLLVFSNCKPKNINNQSVVNFSTYVIKSPNNCYAYKSYSASVSMSEKYINDNNYLYIGIYIGESIKLFYKYDEKHFILQLLFLSANKFNKSSG